MKLLLISTIAIVMTLTSAHNGYAKKSEDLKAMREDINTLKEGQEAIQKDLEAIKSLLLTQQKQKKAPVPFKETYINLQGGHKKGYDSARLVIINFSEYQCPYCAQFFRDAMPNIEKEYINTKKVRYVFMDFPLSFHAQSMKAAEAASCAEEQGKYWEMNECLFANQDTLSPETILKQGEVIGLEMDKFKQCLNHGNFIDAIKSTMAEGQKAGVSGTPTFLLGFIDQDGKVKATKKIVGVQSYTAFKDAIESLLSSDKH